MDDIVTVDPAEAEVVAPARRANRGFWLVAGALLVGCVFMLVEIFANFGMKDTVAHAEHTLRAAQAAAEGILDTDGSFTDADHVRIAAVEPSITTVAGDEFAHGLDQVSVAAESGSWGAAVEARPGACFYLHLTAAGETFYGVGTICTGRGALQATDPRW